MSVTRAYCLNAPAAVVGGVCALVLTLAGVAKGQEATSQPATIAHTQPAISQSATQSATQPSALAQPAATQPSALATTPPATQPATTQPATTQPTTQQVGLGVRDEHTPLALPKGAEGMPMGKTLGYIVLVLLLAAGGMLASRKYLPRIVPRMAGKQVKLVETFHLAPRKQLHVVEVGKQRFLLASGRESVTMLAELRTGSFGEAMIAAEAEASSHEEARHG